MAISYQVSCPPGSNGRLAGGTQAGGPTVTVLNSHATEPLYIGGNENVTGGGSVSTANGLRLAAGQSITVTLNHEETLWGQTGTSTVTITVHVFRSNIR